MLRTLFGVILTKSEAVSWFRIQEMFRFQAFHMYGAIGSAVVIGLVSIQLIKRYNLKTINGEEIRLADKQFSAALRPGLGAHGGLPRADVCAARQQRARGGRTAT